jgi:hypothetical protein
MHNKSINLNIKISPIYKTALVALARLEDESISVVLRRLIRVAAEKCGVWPGMMMIDQSDQTQKGAQYARDHE